MTSPDPARTRFQALVDLWRIQSDGTLDLERGRLLNRCADDLSALLVQEEGRTEWKAAPDAVERESSTRKDELKPAPSVKEQDAPEILLVQEAPQEEPALVAPHTLAWLEKRAALEEGHDVTAGGELRVPEAESGPATMQTLVERWRVYSGSIDAAPVWEVRAAFKLCADELSAALLVPAAPRSAQHGRDCPKVPHVGGGYLHDTDDDRPYEVDRVAYCGRCHCWLESPFIPAAPQEKP